MKFGKQFERVRSRAAHKEVVITSAGSVKNLKSLNNFEIELESCLADIITKMGKTRCVLLVKITPQYKLIVFCL